MVFLAKKVVGSVMNIENELKNPLNYSWSLPLCMLEIIMLILLGVIFYKYFWHLLKNYVIIPDVNHLKDNYIKKLRKLYKNIQDQKIDLREGYAKLSKLIREFIEKSTGINVLVLSKNEIKKLEIKELSLLMEEYYPPEFSKISSGDFLKSINRSIEVIKFWK